ncbi:LOW QUALITY PROTEIN: nuclear pore membrane glycoprotein 210-like [Labeo rohita]|uniref:LOW QUALITY PROTEIN: nuclear pore membrane glycoprotein 210-like n=1 Tax=Labeo rohita TaxID=84645 RepID=UPI0021E23725|nr:LOW QUALITY PROTEIN: nuclear pore membrane glycoprotein 210-like [Labeo rohita]
MSSLITLSKSTKLNVPKLLLPLSTHVPVNITLTAQRGCYKWVSSKPETVRVYPLSTLSPPALLPLSSCSQQCLVSALSSPQAVPLRTVVQAQDPVTGHILRCDVIINRIERIQIVTTVRQLFTDDPPLQLSVRAFDSEGNTFSCLAGLKFNWRLVKESDAIQAVRFVRHHDAGYAPPPHILSLESAGQWGESVLLYGIHSGSALIKVYFQHPEFEHVEAASVTLFVIDRLHLSPAGDTYLLQGSTIRYTLWKTEQEGETEVTLSEEGYSLVVDGYKGIISFQQETATVTALEPGHATLSVTHNNLPSEITSQLLRTSVYVVKPSYMTFSIKEEEDRWVLETGRQYYLTVRIHDDKGHVVHLSQNVVIVVEETEGLVTLESLSDPTCHLLQTIMKGKTLIQASLYSIVSENGNYWPVIPPIRVRQEMEIYNPLTLQPPVIVFPWQPHNKLYQHNIQVEGGSGFVSWEVSDREIATVTVKGVVTAGTARGQAEIQVSDSKNALHKVVGKVMVVRPARLQLIPQRGDCRVGDRIEIPIALWGIQDSSNTCSQTNYVFNTHSDTHRSISASSQENVFSDTHSLQCGESLLEDRNLVLVTDCSQLSLHVHSEPAGIFAHMSGSPSPGPGFCGGVRMEAVSQGHAVVTITVETEGCSISETTTLVAYSPLKSLVSEVLLSVGSSRVVMFEGGPRPWPPAPFRFFSDVEVQPERGVTVEALRTIEAGPPRHAYRVTCTAMGEQWLVFRCGNTPGPLNEIPAVEESRVQVVCGVPASLSLSLLSSPSSPSSIPVFSHHYSCTQPHFPCGLLSVSKMRDATLQLSVLDRKGVQFDNFTSCSVNWTSSDPGLLSLCPQSTMKDRLTQTGYKLHAWQVLQAHRQTGIVTVNVTLRCPEMLTAPVSQCVNLRLVDDVQWARHSVTLFNHPKVTENLSLIHGSGHFQIHLQDNQLASINHVENGNIIQVSPLQSGSSVLLAHDLCLTSDPAVASLLVSDIKDFRIDFINTIEVRHSAVVQVHVLDSKNQPFLHHYLLLMNLMLIPSSSIISVENVGSVDKYSVGFSVTGLKVGVVSFHLSAVDGHGCVISSSHKNMQVYSPFILQPCKLTLAVGSVRQVKWEGGPQPQYAVKFSVSDSSIAVVTETGLVRGLTVGVVKLRGALQTQNTEAFLTFLQDEVEVEVFNLTAVRIQAPLVTLSIGTEMPVYVMGSDSSQNPLSLGSVEVGLSFHWSLSKAGVLEIKPRHARVGVSVSPSHSFSVLVRARAPGRTSLKVRVRLQQIDTSNTSLSDHLTDEIQILVFEEMQLTAGSSGSILMSPLSQYPLQSNKDSVHYTLSRCVSGKGLVTLDDQGVLRTGPDTGLAILEVYAMDVCGINQTLLISVEVSTVWFVRTLSVSSVNSDSEKALPAFPLGWSVRFRTLYYDNMGQQFHSHNVQTMITANRDDLVQLIVDKDSQSFLVQTASPGLTVLRVQGDTTNPFLSDYTPLFVMPAISEPPGFLRSGDVICFSSPITDQQGQRGRWDVSSNKILQINSETGVAFAKNFGTVVVYYKLEGGQQTFREVTVEPASIPVLILPADRLLTNWPEASEYTVRVDLNTSAVSTAQCNLDQWEAIENELHPEAELLCSLNFGAPYPEMRVLQAIFHASPFYDANTAQYSCRISVQPQSDSILHLLSTLPLSIHLSACLRTQSTPAALSLPQSPPSFQSSLQLPYVPAFHCPVTKIKLSSQQPVAEITVFGTTNMLSTLRVQSDTPDIVLSDPVRSDEDPTLILISVYSTSHFLDQVPSAASITLYTDLSPQKHVVMVTRVMDNPESGHLGVYSNSGHFFISIFALFAVLASTAALFIVYNSMLSLTRTVPAVLTPSANTDEDKQHFYLWLTPSMPKPQVLQRKQWLWSTK